MTRIKADYLLSADLLRRDLPVDVDHARVLRRAERTLHRWAELECGDGNEWASWCIERDEATGKPYLACYPHNAKPSRSPIPDRERGALKRVAAVCAELGLTYYHQTDPRGCALYVAREALTDSNYSSRGVAVCS